MNKPELRKMIISIAIFILCIIWISELSEVKVYVINNNKELVYHLSGTELNITVYADEDAGYCYIINKRNRQKKKSTENTYKVNLSENIVLVKKAFTLEII